MQTYNREDTFVKDKIGPW